MPALAVLHDQQVAQAIVLYTLETVLGAALLHARIGSALRPLAWDDATAVSLRRARQATATAAFVSLILGFLVLAFFVAFDVRPANLFDPGTWQGASLDGFWPRLGWMASGLGLAAVLDTWFAPVRSAEWLETSAAWQLRRVAAPAFAYLPGAALTAWLGSSAGFVWPWLLVRAAIDLTALRPGERARVRREVFERP